MSNLIPVDAIAQMAVSVANSGLFGVKNADQAMALMLIAQAEGMHPAIAARDYHVINGRATLKADAMLARFHTLLLTSSCWRTNQLLVLTRNSGLALAYWLPLAAWPMSQALMV